MIAQINKLSAMENPEWGQIREETRIKKSTQLAAGTAGVHPFDAAAPQPGY